MATVLGRLAKRRLLPMLLAAVTALTGLAACGGGDRLDGTLRVVAPTALTEALTRTAREFERRHAGATVQLTFGTKADLEAVRASADVVVTEVPTGSILTLVSPPPPSGPAPVSLARAQLVLAVPAGNALRIAGPADLARPGLRVALCAATEPCGVVTAGVLGAAGVAPAVPAAQPTTRAALAVVARGDADAAIVYRSDTRGSTSVDTVEFAGSAEVLADFGAAVRPGAGNPALADAFVQWAASFEGREPFSAAGFLPPD